MIPTECMCDDHMLLELSHIRTMLLIVNSGVRLPKQEMRVVTIEPKSFISRQQELRSALTARGIPAPDLFHPSAAGESLVTPVLDLTVDKALSWFELGHRCSACRRRIRNFGDSLALYLTKAD